MTISIFLPQETFTKDQQSQLTKIGVVRYTKNRDTMMLKECITFSEGSDIIAADPDNFGGFEKAWKTLKDVVDALPNLKGLALSTTSFGWIDLEYCKKKNIPVCNIPGYSRESVAEHTLALLLCMAKRIILTDRRTQKGAYTLEMGFELKGKTLGIIGLGNIGSRTAQLAQGIGMNVIAYNRSPKDISGVEMKTLDEVLSQSDAIAIHITDSDGNEEFIGSTEIAKMKKGVIIVNTANGGAVNEQAMAEAIKAGHVDMYTCEGTLFKGSPLERIERAIGVEGFGYYTKESLFNLAQILIENVAAIAAGKPQHVVNT